MYKEKKILALIPARGGSKGLPGKNIRILGDKPLIGWSVEAAKQSKYVDEVVITTDDDAIAEVGRKCGALVPFKRPAELAVDTAEMMDVLIHAMDYIKANLGEFDYLVLLQPTSPFRRAEHIDEAIELLFEKHAKVILGVTECEHSPLRSNVLPGNGNMENFYDSKLQYLNRQEMEVYYRLNGAIYVIAWHFLYEQRKWFSEATYAYRMNRRESIDIDVIEDFLFAEALLENSNEG